MTMFLQGDSIQIREVWSDNLEAEMALIREVVDDFPYVSMDTEFPGIVFRPFENIKTITEYHYKTLRTNVNLMKMIQLGLTFSNESGNLPTCGSDKYCIWQFNFCDFDPVCSISNQESIKLLRNSGIDFKKNYEKGVHSKRFAELLLTSGVVLNENVQWVTFHGVYDLAYLLKVLIIQDLPEKPKGFDELIRLYFPRFCDIKHLMKFCIGLSGGLNKLAELLGVERLGISHQAGSDSLLTSRIFMILQDSFFNGSVEKFKRTFAFLRKVTMSGEEAAPAVVPPTAEPAAIPEDMDLLTALELTLRKARAHGGVTRGLHESAKLIEKRVAQLCVLAEDCNQPDYVKLVKALCADHNINLLTVPSAKTLGEWAGLCKIDSEGNARKVVGCSCLVVKDYGEETTALNIVKKHIESN
uniref:40S ribosomal protein S12 n=3 Tax=Brassica oleracea TaxID=3712 RepID=A0A0D3BSV5_BRAOL|nr:unnamed protein product [Brassica oleracea]